MWTSQSATADDEGASRRIRLTYTSFLAAHGVAATVLISLGAIIGRISPTQVRAAVRFAALAAGRQGKASSCGGVEEITGPSAPFRRWS